MNPELGTRIQEMKKLLDEGYEVKVFDYPPDRNYVIAFYTKPKEEEKEKSVVFYVTYQEVDDFFFATSTDEEREKIQKELTEAFDAIHKANRGVFRLFYVALEALKNKK